MLVHICCSVDSHFFLQKLKEVYPNEELVGFFYDPNIHPHSEYKLRLLDVKRSCDMLGIELLEGEYDYQSWLDGIKGYEDEPEKGARCTLCFEIRVKRAFKEAKELGCKRVTTTLLTSPKKSIEQLREVGKRLEKRYGIEFISPDFRASGGTQEQFALAKRDKLYHQNYCGCMFALNRQRASQDKISLELLSPINRQTFPNSIEEKLELYQKRCELEEDRKSYEIVKKSFLNYRILYSKVVVDKKTIPSYTIAYSTLKRKKVKLRVEKKINSIFYANRDNLKFIEISYLNRVLKRSFNSVKELYRLPLSFEDELELRESIETSFYTLSPIVVVDTVDFLKFEYHLNSVTFEDVRENLVIF